MTIIIYYHILEPGLMKGRFRHLLLDIKAKSELGLTVTLNFSQQVCPVEIIGNVSCKKRLLVFNHRFHNKIRHDFQKKLSENNDA